REEAVPPLEEAVRLRRQLAAENPAFVPDLATALNNRGIRYGEVGRSVEAVAPLEEAVRLRRQLAAGNPAFVSDLASALNNLGGCYSELGRGEEAVAPAEESVRLRRALAAENPAFVPDLASALNNLGIHYGSLAARMLEAVAPAEEAVELYRDLVPGNPRFVPDLASALSNLGVRYGSAGRLVEAVGPTEEAVALRRVMAAENPAFVPNLATALINLGIRYGEVGRRVEAVALTEEAVRLRRQLAAENPALVANLASALHDLGARFAEVGRQGDTELAWQAAVDALPPTAARELRVHQAMKQADVAEAVAGFVGVVGRGEVEPSLLALAHNGARVRRAEEPDEFDAAWEAATGDVPAWLTLDHDHLSLVMTWVSTPTYAEAHAVAGRHAEALLSPATDLALSEFAIVAGDDAVAHEHQVLAVARAEGFDIAYRPFLAREEVRRFLDADFEGQMALLAANRSALVDPSAQRALVELGATGPGVALLALAVAGHDREAVAALDGLFASSLVADLAGAGDGAPLVALGELAVSRATTMSAAVAGLVVAALGFQLVGVATVAVDAVHQARRLDQSEVDALAAHLFPLYAAQPALAALATAFTDPLPPEPDEDGS
ncbi:MAG TPA: tetratricopeptide repeat protein, partial [Iamia sp.]